jgi:hypothetical protein
MENFLIAIQLFASQGGLCFMELVLFSKVLLTNNFFSFFFQIEDSGLEFS